MRFAYMVTHFPSFSETFTLNQITGLIDRGHQVDIYADTRGDMSRMHPDIEKYDLLKHTYYPEVPDNKLLRILKLFSPELLKNRKHFFAALRALNPFKYGRQALSFRLFYEIKRFFDKPDYDVLHCTLEPIGLQGMLYKDLLDLKATVVTSWRGHDFDLYIHRIKGYTYDELYRRGDLFIPICDFLKREMIDQGCPEEKIVTVLDGIHIDDFPYRPRTGRADGAVRLISIGRLVPNKAIDDGIRAVARCLDRHPNIQYNIIGDGPMMEELQQLVRDLGAEDNIHLLGWRVRNEVIGILNDADIMITPSITGPDGAREGIPNVLKEAMAMGMPVIGTYHSGIPELIEDGVSGVLVPERDVDALASAVDRLVAHPDTWPAMGQAGRAHIEAHYDIEKLNDVDLINAYQFAV